MKENQACLINARDAMGLETPTHVRFVPEPESPIDKHAQTATEREKAFAQSVEALDATTFQAISQAAHAMLAADDERWTLIMRGPYNELRTSEQREAAEHAYEAWLVWCEVLCEHGIQLCYRREFAHHVARQWRLLNG